MLAAGYLDIPHVAPRRPRANLALSGFTMLTTVRWENATLLCRLDTGAGRTQVYEPFYHRFKPLVDAGTQPAMRRMGGACGVSERSVRVFPELPLALGDTMISAKQVDVVTQRLVPNEEDTHLDGNVGRDVLGAFSQAVLNLRDMALILR